MKVIKTASGNQVKMSKSEWETIGKTAGWINEAAKLRDMSTRDVERGYENYVNREIDRMEEGDEEYEEDPRRRINSEDIANMELIYDYYKRKHNEAETAGGETFYWGGKTAPMASRLKDAKTNPNATMEEWMLGLYRKQAIKLKNGEEL